MRTLMEEYICPHCHNPIYDDDALLCHFCGESLHRAGQGVLGRMKYAKSRMILIFFVVLLLMVFIGFLFF